MWLVPRTFDEALSVEDVALTGLDVLYHAVPVVCTLVAQLRVTDVVLLLVTAMDEIIGVIGADAVVVKVY